MDSADPDYGLAGSKSGKSCGGGIDDDTEGNSEPGASTFVPMEGDE